jgi:hypothetical protein
VLGQKKDLEKLEPKVLKVERKVRGEQERKIFPIAGIFKEKFGVHAR